MKLVGTVARLDTGKVVRLRPRQKIGISMTLKQFFQTLLGLKQIGSMKDGVGAGPDGSL
jgi:hypothetical protein